MLIIKNNIGLYFILILSLTGLLWLAFDFYQAFFLGEVSKLRSVGTIFYEDDHLLFLLTIGFKLILGCFFAFMLCITYKELRRK